MLLSLCFQSFGPNNGSFFCTQQYNKISKQILKQPKEHCKSNQLCKFSFLSPSVPTTTGVSELCSVSEMKMYTRPVHAFS